MSSSSDTTDAADTIDTNVLVIDEPQVNRPMTGSIDICGRTAAVSVFGTNKVYLLDIDPVTCAQKITQVLSHPSISYSTVKWSLHGRLLVCYGPAEILIYKRSNTKLEFGWSIKSPGYSNYIELVEETLVVAINSELKFIPLENCLISARFSDIKMSTSTLGVVNHISSCHRLYEDIDECHLAISTTNAVHLINDDLHRDVFSWGDTGKTISSHCIDWVNGKLMMAISDSENKIHLGHVNNSMKFAEMCVIQELSDIMSLKFQHRSLFVATLSGTLSRYVVKDIDITLEEPVHKILLRNGSEEIVDMAIGHTAAIVLKRMKEGVFMLKTFSEPMFTESVNLNT